MADTAGVSDWEPSGGRLVPEQRRVADRHKAELEQARRERDDALVALLHLEQELARGARPAEQADAEVERLLLLIEGLIAEVTQLRQSSSWRLTAPLRRLRDAQLRLRRRALG